MILIKVIMVDMYTVPILSSLLTEVDITIMIAGSIGSIGTKPASGTFMEIGMSSLGISPAVRQCDIFWNPRGTSLGWPPCLLHQGVLVLGSPQMRWMQKYPQVLALPPRGVRFLCIAWNYSTDGIPCVCQVHSPQWQPLEENKSLPTVGIPDFLPLNG